MKLSTETSLQNFHEFNDSQKDKSCWPSNIFGKKQSQDYF